MKNPADAVMHRPGLYVPLRAARRRSVVQRWVRGTVIGWPDSRTV